MKAFSGWRFTARFALQSIPFILRTKIRRHPATGAFLCFFGTGWNDVPEKRSTRKTPARQRVPRKSATGTNKGRSSGGNLPVTEGAAVSGKLPVNRKLSEKENITRQAELARGLVLKSWTAIVQGLIKKAKTGGYQQTKLLLDLCELTNADGSAGNEQRGRQLCDALLEGLGLQHLPCHPDEARDIAVAGENARFLDSAQNDNIIPPIVEV